MVIKLHNKRGDNTVNTGMSPRTTMSFRQESSIATTSASGGVDGPDWIGAMFETFPAAASIGISISEKNHKIILKGVFVDIKLY